MQEVTISFRNPEMTLWIYTSPGNVTDGSMSVQLICNRKRTEELKHSRAATLGLRLFMLVRHLHLFIGLDLTSF